MTMTLKMIKIYCIRNGIGQMEESRQVKVENHLEKITQVIQINTNEAPKVQSENKSWEHCKSGSSPFKCIWRWITFTQSFDTICFHPQRFTYIHCNLNLSIHPHFLQINLLHLLYTFMALIKLKLCKMRNIENTRNR